LVLREEHPSNPSCSPSTELCHPETHSSLVWTWPLPCNVLFKMTWIILALLRLWPNFPSLSLSQTRGSMSFSLCSSWKEKWC